MNIGYEIYEPQKEYFTEDGKIYTNEMFAKKYPAVNTEKMAVYVYGNVISSATPFSYLKGINRIKNDVEDSIAIAMINEKKEQETTENTPIERIAASLEYLVLLFMEDM